jgi:hypothetical protein
MKVVFIADFIGISRKQKISNKYYLHEFLIPHGIGITRKQKISNRR